MFLTIKYEIKNRCGGQTMKIEIKRTSLMTMCSLVHFTSKTINIKINHGPFYDFKTEIMLAPDTAHFWV